MNRSRHDRGRADGSAEAVELRGVRAEEVDEEVRPVWRRLLHSVLPEDARQRPPHQAHVDTRRPHGVRRMRGGGMGDGEQGGRRKCAREQEQGVSLTYLRALLLSGLDSLVRVGRGQERLSVSRRERRMKLACSLAYLVESRLLQTYHHPSKHVVSGAQKPNARNPPPRCFLTPPCVFIDTTMWLPHSLHSLRWPSSGAPLATTPSAPPAGLPYTLAESGACTATARSPPAAAFPRRRSPPTAPTPVRSRRGRALLRKLRVPLGTAAATVQQRRRRRRRRSMDKARLLGRSHLLLRWTRLRR